MVIKRVNPVSAAKVGGVLGVLLGLVIGAGVSLVAMVIGGAAAAASDRPGGAFFAMVFGVGAIVILPILYGCIMFLSGLLQAALYNLASKWTGGVDIEVA